MLSVAAVPGPPLAPEVCDVASTRCTTRYQLPADEGDSPVTGYHLQRRHVTGGEGGEWKTVNERPTTAQELVVDHLEQLSKYEFRVAAENQLGVGEFSPASRRITTDNSVRTIRLNHCYCSLSITSVSLPLPPPILTGY